MALLWVDGFEKYGEGEGNAEPSYILESKYNDTPRFSSQFGEITANGSTGKCVYFVGSTSDRFVTPPLTTNETIIIGVAVKFSAIDDGIFIDLFPPDMYGSVVDYTNLALSMNSTNNEIDLVRAGTILETSNGLNILPNQWYYLEWKATCDDTTGISEVKIDGNTVIDFTGDTKYQTDYDFFSFVSFTAASSFVVYFDDFYVCDGSGNTNNDFLGSCNVYTLSPSSDVSNDWSLSSGNTAYSLLDADTQNISERVSSNTSGDKCKVEFETFNGSGQIAGAMVSCDASVNTTHAVQSTNKIKLNTYNDSGTANYMGDCMTGTNNKSLCSSFIMEKDADGSSWNSTTINDLRVEVEVD